MTIDALYVDHQSLGEPLRCDIDEPLRDLIVKSKFRTVYPRIWLVENDALAGILAWEKTGGPAIRDLGTQHVTLTPKHGRPAARQTTPLKQELPSGDWPLILRLAYGSDGRALQGIAAYMNDEPCTRHHFFGVDPKVWRQIAAYAPDGRREVHARMLLEHLYPGIAKPYEDTRRKTMKFAPLSAPVYIGGEWGTGKELVARAVHLLSGRRGLFVAVNAGGLRSDVGYAELFGALHGGFTDAVSRPGYFEQARGGTLFLDEISRLSEKLQAALLRVLQDGTFFRVGADVATTVDTRVIVATNQDLYQLVTEGRFLPDLYFRLNALVIETPAVRESRADVRFQLRRAWAAWSDTELGDHELDFLAGLPWPGNVRQIENYILRLAALSDREPPSHELVLEALRNEPDMFPAASRSGHVARATTGPATWPDGSAEKAVEAYAARLGIFRDVESGLRGAFAALVRDLKPAVTVRSRLTSVVEFAERLHREGVDALASGARDLLCLRIVVENGQQRDEVERIVREWFLVDDVPSPPVYPLEIRPTSFHVRLDAGGIRRLAERGIDVPSDVAGHVAELEIRTVREETMVGVFRRLGLRPGDVLTESLVEELGELSGALSRVECALDRMRGWTGTYGAYIGAKAAAAELAILEQTIACVPDDPEIAARAAKYAIILGDFEKAIGLLEPHAAGDFGPALRDYGVALCQVSEPGSGLYQRGIASLRRAVQVSPSDPDAFASLAGALRRLDDRDATEEARDLYRSSAEIDESFAYGILGWLEVELELNRSSDLVTTMREWLDRASERCREHIAANVSMPWAYFNLGKIELLRGRIREGLGLYAHGIGRSSAGFMLQSQVRSIDALLEGDRVPRSLSIARQMLATGWEARFPSVASRARLEEAGAGPIKEIAGPVLMLLGSSGDSRSTRTVELRRLLLPCLTVFRGTVIVVDHHDWVTPLLEGPAGEGVAAVAYSNEGVHPALAAWRDILLSGGAASSVLVVDLDDTPTTRPDRELALELGAVAAVLGPQGDETKAARARSCARRHVVVRDAAELKSLVAAQLTRH